MVPTATPKVTPTPVRKLGRAIRVPTPYEHESPPHVPKPVAKKVPMHVLIHGTSVSRNLHNSLDAKDDPSDGEDKYQSLSEVDGNISSAGESEVSPDLLLKKREKHHASDNYSKRDLR